MDYNINMMTVTPILSNFSAKTPFNFNIPHNETYYNSTTEPSSKNDDSAEEIKRMIRVITYPILVIFGTFGNLLSFYVMRKGSMRKVSTCFYMSILALADTGKYNYLWIK